MQVFSKNSLFSGHFFVGQRGATHSILRPINHFFATLHHSRAVINYDSTTVVKFYYVLLNEINLKESRPKSYVYLCFPIKIFRSLLVSLGRRSPSGGLRP